MSAVSASIVCKQGTSWPLKALRKNKRKKEKPNSVGRTIWTPWRRSATWQKPVPHSINSLLEDIKAEKYGPKITTLAN